MSSANNYTILSPGMLLDGSQLFLERGVVFDKLDHVRALHLVALAGNLQKHDNFFKHGHISDDSLKGKLLQLFNQPLSCVTTFEKNLLRVYNTSK